MENFNQTLISSFAALSAATIIYLFIYFYETIIFRRKSEIKVKVSEPTYTEKFQKSIDSLRDISEEIDKVLTEISTISREKEQTISMLESELNTLSNREGKLKDKIKVLEKVPLSALEHFETMLNKGNQRNRKRDYLLFGLGVLTTAITSIIISFV